MFGPDIELNSTIRAARRLLGTPGLYLGTLLPTLGFLSMAWLCHSPLLLGAVAGVRLCLFDFQQTSKELEIAILGELKNRKARAPLHPGLSD